MIPARDAKALALGVLATLALIAAPARAEVSACAAATYQPASQPPFGGDPTPPLERVRAMRGPPLGYELSTGEAIAAAATAAAISAELEESPGAEPRAFTHGPCRWQIGWFDGKAEVARAAVDDRTGLVLEAWRGHQLGSELARGYEGAVAQLVNAPYVWIPLCLLFLAPFFDPRRPGRLLHLDLLAILGLGASLFFFNRGEITASVALTYPVLAWVLGRMLWSGLRPRARPGPLVPIVPVRWLAVAAVALALGRIALNVADSQVIDVGVAGVVGADRITSGEELYEGEFSPGIDLRGDVYGPANYLAYVPFEAVFGWEGEWDEVPAAHAAAIAFDLLVVAGLLALGRRLRSGAAGRELGFALAFAWLACPWTLYAMNANVNDALVAASLVGAMLALSRPVMRGAALAVGAAAKFGTVAVAPLFATAGGLRDRKGILLFAAGFGAACLLAFVPFLPGGGLGELYDRTLGYQAERGSPFSVWGLAPSLDFLQAPTRVAAVALALLLALAPGRRTPIQIAALAAAIIVAVQLGATHWFYFYVVWFLPLYLVAALGETVSSPSSSARPAAAR